MLAQIFKRKAIMLVAAVTMALLLLPASLTSADGEVTQLIGSDTTTSDQFGFAIDVSGDTAVVGVPLDNNIGGSDAGAVFVFRWTGIKWIQEAKLITNDAVANDQLGFSVAIEGDTIAVGAPFDSDVCCGTGSIYIFQRTGVTWTQITKFTASGIGSQDNLGRSLAMDGDTIVAGALFDDEPSNSGAIYVFRGSGASWTQEQKLKASDAATSDEFGLNLDISGDTIVAGAHLHDDIPNDSGAAYVFTRSGTTWSQEQKLTPNDATAGDQFGRSVGISGNTIVAGAHRNLALRGAAYAFTRSGTTWTQEQKLTSSDSSPNREFGSYVAIEGNIAIIAANMDDSGASNSGAAYSFSRSGTTWTQEEKLKAIHPISSDQFGTMLAMEGETLLVGMPFDDDAGNSSGSVFAFRLTILARCTLDVELSFTEGNTLNMDFELSAVDPTTLHLWLVASTGAIQLFSAPIPAIPSLTPFSLPVPGFPNMGMIGVITFMTDAVDGMICFDAETVDTGTTPIAIPSVEQLRELVPAPNGILPEN